MFVRLKYVPSTTRRAVKVHAAGEGREREGNEDERRSRSGETVASCLASFHDSEIRAESIRDVTAPRRSGRKLPLKITLER